MDIDTDLNEITEIAMHKLDMYTDEDGNQPFDIDEEKVEALSESIKENGQLEPIIVRKKDGRYQILSGHHRYLAMRSMLAKYALATVVDVSDLKAYMIVCESNIHHAAPPPSKLCKIFLRYRAAGKEEKLTAGQLAKMFGISREQMYRIIAMEHLTEPTKELIDAGLISTNSIKQLRTLTPDQQDTLADYVYNEDKKLTKGKCDKVIDLFIGKPDATAEDIDDLISKSYISNFNYDLDEAFNKIIEKHTEFEVAQAVALTINAKSWDGRFSQLNKAWADNFITFNGIKTEEYDRFYGCNTHSALLDGFTDVVRKNIANRSINELRGESIAEEQLVAQSAGRK